MGTTLDTTAALADAAKNLMNALAAFQAALADQPTVRPAPPSPVYESLRQWRTEQAKARQVPPYIVATDAVLRAIDAARPADLVQLQAIRGIGPQKAATYGPAILAVVAGTGQAAPGKP